MNLNFRYILAVTFFLSLIVVSLAGDPVKELKMVKKANRIFFDGHTEEALGILTDLDETGVSDANVWFEMGRTYFNMSKFEKARHCFDEVEKFGGLNDTEFHYWYGNACHHSFHYKEALQHYERYYSELPPEDPYREDAVRLMNQMKVILTEPVHENELGYTEIINEINTKAVEAFPIIFNSGKKMYYTSIDRNSRGHFTYSILESHRDDKGHWSTPGPIEGALSKSTDIAGIQLFNDEKSMLLFKERRSGDLYLTHWIDEGWAKPKKIKGISSKSFEESAYITEDGNRIYFSTDYLNKGKNLDLYYADKLDENKWTKPESLGNHINTPFDETAPFLSKDGKVLYYSSNGDKSIGGYDILKSTWDEEKKQWSEPQNMGEPINSTEHDMDFHISPDGSLIAFSSDRNGTTGESDLILVSPKQNAEFIVKLKSQISQKELISADFEMEVSSMDGSNYKYKKAQMMKDGQFTFMVPTNNDYRIVIKRKEEVIYDGEHHIARVTDDKYQLNEEFLVNYELPEDALMASTSSTKAPLQNNFLHKYSSHSHMTLFFGYNKSQLDNRSTHNFQNIIYEMKKDKTLGVVLHGHTDAIGSDLFNQKLSVKRARFVKNMLMGSGVDPNRIQVLGRGEKHPLFPNDTEEHRRKNRRVEIIFDAE